MARTLVGILQILLKQDVTQKAPAINRAIESIERQAQRLGNARWGAGFQRQLDRLKVSPAEAAAITASFDRLARDINGKINRADLAAWRHGTLAHLAQVRMGLKETAAQAKRMHSTIAGAKGMLGNVVKPAMVAFGAYTGWYAAGIAMREGFNASGERQREIFRQDMAGLSMGEQANIAAEAQRLTILHPSVGMTEIMEMARTARNTMGTTEDGLAILEDMVRGLVTLQSSQGVDAGSSSMMRLIRGLDNLGLNAGGEVGLASMRQVMAGAIRAAQIEGGEIDVGQYFDFARRAKVAGPALSDEFLATTSGALMQDMTASGAGNAIAMLFKSFVLGDNSINGKVYKARQEELGLRDENGLVDARTMGENPYVWTKTHLIPALQAAGVDLTNDTDVAAAVGRLSGNTNATGLLTRMITQSDQIERLIGMYAQAMGPDAADSARERDPFVALKGMTSALGNFSAALGEHVMPVIVPALNAMTDTINGIAASMRDASGLQVGLGSLAAIVAGIGAFKVGSAAFGGIVALTTAGPSLQTAATMLQGAATSLGGAGAVDGVAGAPVGAAAGKGGATLLLGAPLIADWIGTQIMGPMTPEQQELRDGAFSRVLERIFVGDPSAAPEPPSPYEGLRAGAIDWGLNPDATTVDTSQIEEAGAVADATTTKLGALNSVLTPQVDLSSINALIGLLQHALALQGRLRAPGAGGPRSNVSSSFSDYGVTP